MNKTQKAYATAKARFTTIENRRNRQMKSHNELLESDPEAYFTIECEIENKLGYWEAHDELINAENAMVKWGHEVMKKHPQYKNNQKGLELLFTKGMIMITQRKKIVETIYKLDETK
jgi:hypothetical protein